MDTLLHIGLSNAVVAAVLALLAALVTRLWRRPALAHALWLLVLLKLLSPPLWPVALPLPAPNPSANTEGEPKLPPVTISPGPRVETGNATVAPPPRALEAAVEEEPLPPPPPMVRWEPIVLAVWLGGSVLWWALAARRLHRFRRLLVTARVAGDMVQEQARGLAARLGLKRCPVVWMVPAPVSPMLLALGRRPRLLLPEALWKQLTGEQQDALLAHELAHLRRGDPWVRRLELVVLGLYWWHPVVWWARHELQEAEEQCCDAWVVWALPEAAAAYATALVDTVAFLSRSRAALPVGASGAGRVPLLKRRLTMILRGNAPRTLSRAGFWLLLAVAMVLLPLAPGGARTEPPGAKAEGETSKAAVVPVHWPRDRGIEKHMMAVCTSCHAAVTPPRPPREATLKTWKQAHDEVVKLLAEVKQTQGRLREAEARLERALKVLQRTGPTQEGSAGAPENPDAWAEALFDTRYKHFGRIVSGPIIATEFRLTNRTPWPLVIVDVRQSSGALDVKVPSRRLNRGETSVIRVAMDTRRLIGSRSAAVYLTLANDLGPDVARNERTRGAEVKLVVHAIIEKTPGPKATPTPGMPRALDDKKRLEQMEKILEEMRREMQELRRELHPKKPIADPLLDLEPPAKPARPGDPMLRTSQGSSRQEAQKHWRVAEFYRRTGHPGSARFYFEIVRHRYSGTPEAKRAGTM